MALVPGSCSQKLDSTCPRLLRDDLNIAVCVPSATLRRLSETRGGTTKPALALDYGKYISSPAPFGLFGACPSTSLYPASTSPSRQRSRWYHEQSLTQLKDQMHRSRLE